MENFINVLYNKNSLLVLSYISKNVFSLNTATSIARDLNLAVSSVHSILKTFENFGLTRTKTIGKSIVYEIDGQNPIFKTFRAFDNIANLLPMIQQLKLISYKIILFGSCSKGEDTLESDVDLFILTDNKDRVNNVIEEANYERPINPVIVDTIEIMQLAKENKIFYEEINKGIILWEE